MPALPAEEPEEKEQKDALDFGAPASGNADANALAVVDDRQSSDADVAAGLGAPVEDD